ncbi:MAG: magnesium/cobalt transporter CorA [Flavobacteriales bacterium]
MIQLFTYNEAQFERTDSESFDTIKPKLGESKVNWINLPLNDKEEVKRHAESFGIHPLLIEDIYNTDHLPKMERFDNYLFFTLKMFSYKPDKKMYCREHLSLVLGKNYVISFQQALDEDVFEEVRDRIVNDKGILRKQGADYLFYRLLDAIVDNYLLIAENYRSQIEELEDYLYENANENVVPDIVELKRSINQFRKETIPVREELGRLMADKEGLIKKSTQTYFQDIYDHMNHLSSNFEIYREMIKDLMDINHANLSNNLNRVMKTLTVVASIFIPLTFIVGIYGMNFENMPELSWPWAYPSLMLFMLFMSLGLVWYMRRKKWF